MAAADKAEKEAPILVAAFPGEPELWRAVRALEEQGIGRDFIGVFIGECGQEAGGPRTLYLLSVLAPSRLHPEIKGLFAECGATAVGGPKDMGGRYGVVPHPGALEYHEMKVPMGPEYPIVRDRKGPATEASRSAMRRLNIAATVLALLATVGLPAAVMGYQSLRASSFDGQVIDLVGAHGAWHTAAGHETAIRLKEGERVRLRLASHDVVHGFSLQAFGIEVDEVRPGKVKTIEFVADKPGTFSFTCTVLCSPEHRNMKGELVVEPQQAPVGAALEAR